MLSSPCFLVGAERSGTTLLRLMLCHHPQIAWSSEFEYAVDRLPEAGGWPDLADYAEFLRTHRVFQSHGHQIDPSLSYPELVDSFLRQTQRKQGNKPVVGATVHRHFDRLLRIWPDARFIHIVRDGRDVARSNVVKGWAGNYWTGVERWVEAERLWASMRAALPAERCIEIRYETLIAEPEYELARLCAFLNLPYDAAMLDYTKTTRFARPDPKLTYQWRTKLAPEEIRLAEARIGPMLVERGYELSGLPPLEVTAAVQQRLRRQDAWARLRHRWQSAGPCLFLEDFVARRIGPKAWRDQVKLHINRLAQSRLK